MASVDRAAAKEQAAAHFADGLKHLKTGQYEEAIARFTDAEAWFAKLPETHRQSAVVARIRRAGALAGLDRYREALTILDAILDADMTLPDFPDEIPLVRWSQIVCLRHLGRSDDASAAARKLIRRVDPGATPKQRLYVTRAFLMQAEISKATGDLHKALAATEEAMIRSSQSDEPAFAEVHSEAKQMRASLLKKV